MDYTELATVTDLNNTTCLCFLLTLFRSLHYNIVFSNSHSTTVLLFLTQSCRNEPTMSQNFLHCHCSYNQSCGTRSRPGEVTLFQGKRNITETGIWLDKTVNQKAAHESPHHVKVQGAWSSNLNAFITAALSRSEQWELRCGHFSSGNRDTPVSFHGTGGWMGLRTGLDDGVKNKFLPMSRNEPLPPSPQTA
jgi:hypothetical protein